MRTARLLAIVAVAALGLMVTATAVADQPITQRNFEVGVFAFMAPTNTTCVLADVRADVLSPLQGGFQQAPVLFWSLGFYDTCSDQWLQVLDPLVAPLEISAAEFSMSPST